MPQRVMLHAVGLHILDRQFVAGLVGVDGLVLGPVIAEDPLNVGNAPDGPDIADEERKADDTLKKSIDNGMVVGQIGQPATGKGRQQEEEANGKGQADGDGRPGDRAAEVGVFFALFLHGDLAAPHQRAHAQPQRVPEQRKAADKRLLAPGTGVDLGGQRLFVEDDFVLWVSDCHSHGLASAHHDAFDHSLATVILFAHADDCSIRAGRGQRNRG